MQSQQPKKRTEVTDSCTALKQGIPALKVFNMITIRPL